MKTLPDAVGQLKSLKSLYLEINQITDLPPYLGQLPLLNELHLSGNNLKQKKPPKIAELISTLRKRGCDVALEY